MLNEPPQRYEARIALLKKEIEERAREACEAQSRRDQAKTEYAKVMKDKEEVQVVIDGIKGIILEKQNELSLLKSELRKVQEEHMYMSTLHEVVKKAQKATIEASEEEVRTLLARVSETRVYAAGAEEASKTYQEALNNLIEINKQARDIQEEHQKREEAITRREIEILEKETYLSNQATSITEREMAHKTAQDNLERSIKLLHA